MGKTRYFEVEDGNMLPIDVLRQALREHMTQEEGKESKK